MFCVYKGADRVSMFVRNIVTSPDFKNFLHLFRSLYFAMSGVMLLLMVGICFVVSYIA